MSNAAAARRPEIKVCGITRAADAAAARAAGADYLGLVFVGWSSRRVHAEGAREVVRAAKGARWVGVFADAPVAEVAGTAAALGLPIVQLHGREDATAIRVLRERGLQVWKTVGVTDPPDWEAVTHAVEPLVGCVDALLLDRALDGRTGGTGRAFDWDGIPVGLRRLIAGGRFVLSGGLTAENVGRAVARLDPDVVDVSGGVEEGPGRKDAACVLRFVRAARAVHAGRTAGAPTTWTPTR